VTIEQTAVEQATGELFGQLFPAYDDQAFLASVEAFAQRLALNDFPLDWFRDKECLDAGCGGGRYSIALSLLGARHVLGLDVSRAAIADARRRAETLGITNVAFEVGSVERLPCPDGSLDAVVCSGVLHHTERPEQGMAELARVLRPKGMLYLLMYATEGFRWPTIQLLRPLARDIGLAAMECAVAEAQLPVNKRRTYLDDLFVPVIDFYTWARLADVLARHGFEQVQRWDKGQLDHEGSLEAYLADLEGLQALFAAGARSHDATARPHRNRFVAGLAICEAAVEAVRQAITEVAAGTLSEREARQRAIGQGHHRVVAWKAARAEPGQAQHE
jgi:ubiquinone/menaquinone biosynthesis C-methylase UbiE